MALFVEGFNEIQQSFVMGYSKEIDFKSHLDKTREGSCIADVLLSAKELIRNASLAKIMDNIYYGTRDNIACVEKMDSPSDFRKFSEDVYMHSSNEDAYQEFTTHGEADLYMMANGFNKIHQGKQRLTEGDSVQFGRGNDFQNISEKMSCPRKPDEIFEDVDTPFPAKEVFVVRRPSYVSGLMWDFESEVKRPKKFSASMLDDAWVERWRNHEVELWPGDALFVETRTIRKTNSVKHSKPKYEIQVIKVIKRIPQEDIESFTLGLDNET
ncbi:hypothetical protein L4D17_00125 [Vibrio splendidus]|uniref:hypothetical protein n=1 Tax=Vibrio splendidus TaxID=29497 RepID=UPI003D13A80B